MEIFELPQSFPAEERYALVSQIRRSSRSISMNLREAWAKRRYEAHFISKLTDCDGEKRGRTGAVLDSRVVRRTKFACGANLSKFRNRHFTGLRNGL
jgi:hypothetical protein